MQFAYRAFTSANPNLMISPDFIEANYEVHESLLREQRRPIRNEDLQTELDYFSEDYNEERELEPRPRPTRETTPPLRPRSPGVHSKGKWKHGNESSPILGSSLRKKRNRSTPAILFDLRILRPLTID
ncbi:hypothetical protein Tco_1506308 [Tanacetum coccineum]